MLSPVTISSGWPITIGLPMKDARLRGVNTSLALRRT
jgi:hypothetical protein